jgi:hypothetical protein
VGSFATLAIGGVRRRHLDLEKRIRETVTVTLDAVLRAIAVGSTVDVTLLGEREAHVGVIVRRRPGLATTDDLAGVIAAAIAEKTSCRCNVTVEDVPVSTHRGIPR